MVVIIAMKKKNSGMTLVEIIVAMAILGIISITFLSIFSGMFKGIVNAGQRSKATFGAQQDLENYIATNTTNATDNLVITYNGLTSVTIEGENMSVPKTSGSTTITVDVFVPNY